MEFFNPFKDDEFWYSFLEQSVECYDFLVSSGAIDAPVKGGYIQSASEAINDLQTHYRFTYRTKDVRKYRDENGEKNALRLFLDYGEQKLLVMLGSLKLW